MMMASARTRTPPCPRIQTVPMLCQRLRDPLATSLGTGRSPNQQSFERCDGGLQRLDPGGEPPVLVVHGVESLVVEHVPGVEQTPGCQRDARLGVRGCAQCRLAGVRATPP